MDRKKLTKQDLSEIYESLIFPLTRKEITNLYKRFNKASSVLSVKQFNEDENT